MFDFLKTIHQPHPLIFNHASMWVPGVVTFLVLALLAPFGFAEYSLPNRLFFALVFGVLGSTSVLFTVVTLKKIAPTFMDEERWTIIKEITLIFMVIAVICVFIVGLFLIFDLSSTPFLTLILQVISITIGISFFPISLLVLFEQWGHQKKIIKEAETWMKAISNTETKAFSKSVIKDKTVKLIAENGNEELCIDPRNILFLKSDGNYVEVFYQAENRAVGKKLIRNRLKELHIQLPNASFFQCHKSFIINLSHINKVSGNARNFEIELEYISQSIPVSRSKTEELKNLFMV